MTHLYTFIALDLAHERVREAQRARRAALAVRGIARQPNIIRRGLASALALLSRWSAAAARRLDAVAVDKRPGALTTGK